MMRDLIAVAGIIALPWMAGTLWVMALRRGAPDRGWLLEAGYGYLLGLLATTVVMRIESAAGVAFSLAGVAAPMAVLALAGYALARPLPPPREAWSAAAARARALPSPMKAVFWLALAVIVVRLASLSLEVAWRPPQPWDAWSQWATKSRVWFEFGRIVPFVSPAEWLRRGELLAFMDMHSSYPGTVPLIHVWTLLCVGRWDDTLMNAPWPVLAATLGCALFAQARRAGAGLPKAMVFGYLLLSLPFLDIHVALAGIADLFVAATWGMAAVALWQWTLTRQRSDLVLAALLAAACPAIKLEGLFWALALVPPALVAVHRRLGLGLVAALGLAALLYLSFGPEQIVVYGYVLQTRFTNVTLPLFQHLFVMDNWHLLWYGAVAAIVLRWRRLFAPDLAPMTVTMLGALAFVAVVFYWSSASGGVDDESLVNRLPLHLTPALVFYLLLLLREPAPPPRSAASAL